MNEDEVVIEAEKGTIIPAGLKPLLMLIGVAAAVAAGVGVVLWSQGPSYSLLYGNLGDADKAQVVASLDQAAIPYRLEPGTGAVLVPSDKVSDARMKLAAKGLPESGGYSLMDKDPGFGVSQFMESARYQHAIETELGRTIASLKQVEGARVHLAMPAQSAFLRDKRQASASVFLQMKNGRRLEREQISSIINLVASSIPDMDPNQVTVIDSQGRLLSSPDRDGEVAQREQQIEIARRMEEDYAQRIESLLSPILGNGRVKAQVVAQVEMSATEEAREQYRPDSQILRSEQTSEESTRTGPNAAQGVPGSLSNQPPQGGTVGQAAAAPAAATPAVAGAPGATAPGAQVAAAATASAATPENSNRQATRNYELDRTIAYTKNPAGRLQRLSVAVLVDNMRKTDKDGNTTEEPLTEEQVERLKTLVKDAVGFDEKRGDTVSVVNQGFHTEPISVPEIEKTPLLEQPIVREVARIAAGLVIVVLLLVMVVRPLIKGLTPPPKPILVSTSGVMPQLPSPANSPSAPAPLPPPMPGIPFELQLEQAKTIVSQDAPRVAQVLKEWVQNDV
jgi:flagellar M-ring protein FliF